MPYDTETGEWIEPDQGGAPDQSGTQRTNSEWAQYRQVEKAKKTAEQERDSARRELAFMRAGIDPERDPKLAFFVKGYEGDLTPEAIRKAAVEVGFLAPPEPDQQAGEQQQQQAADLAAAERVNNASTGAAPPPTDPSTLLQDAFNKGGKDGLLHALSQQGIPLANDGVIME